MENIDQSSSHLGESYCGIWCGSCSVRVFGDTGHADPFIRCFHGVPEEALVCSGCKSNRLYAGCRHCAIRDCAKKEGVAHCGDCKQFPCKTWTNWNISRRLVPHIEPSRGNLETAKKQGAAAWRAEQETRWSCPQCGTTFSWYAESCGNCGQDLSAHTFRLNPLRRFLCRMIFPRLYRRAEGK